MPDQRPHSTSGQAPDPAQSHTPDQTPDQTPDHTKAWFVLLESHPRDPLWPCRMNCYVRAVSCGAAREMAVGYFATHPVIAGHFKRPTHSIIKRLRLCLRCPDMDAAVRDDPAINHERAVMLGLSALSIIQDGDRPELVWQAHRSVAEARQAERTLLEDLLAHIPADSLITAIKAIAADKAEKASAS